MNQATGRLMKLALLLLFAIAALADVVTLKDGRQITGEIESGTTREIRIKVDNVEQLISVDQILSIQFGAATASALAPVAVSPQTITLPAGTEIAIRTIDEIDSKTADEYREYAASLDAPVAIKGVTILPAQTRALFRVTDIVKPGLRRRASFSLTLVAVMISGQRNRIETSKLESEGSAQGRRTGKAALIGGATGAAFGAIFGGALGSGVGPRLEWWAEFLCRTFFKKASESRPRAASLTG
jgi:hypothetical protein